MQSFSHYVGIDWTGAKGPRHPGLKVAMCEVGNTAPELIDPPSGTKNWSRLECTEWLAAGMGLPSSARVLVGIDAAFGYPFNAESGYLRGDSKAQSAPDLWQEIAQICGQAEDLFGGAFVERHARHYRFQRYNPEARTFDTVVDNDFFRPDLRLAEKICIDDKYGPCESVFNLIGASQVGKSALSTMNMLHRLKAARGVAIWPFDHTTDNNIVLVEIYAAIFSKLGGGRGKVRDVDTLNRTLAGLGSDAFCGDLPAGSTADDAADALMTAAGLRAIAGRSEYWHPEGLSPMVRDTEGWIFGVG